MSTTFGIYIPVTGKTIPIARRVSGEMWFTNPAAELLEDDTEVIAMDNINNDIHTIEDIKRAIIGTISSLNDFDPEQP